MREYFFRELPIWLIGLLTNWMPDHPKVCRLRGYLAAPFFGSCGRNLQFGTRVRFLKPSSIHLGNDVYFAEGCWISGTGRLYVEDEVLVGPFCLLVTAHHKMDDGSARFAKGLEAPVRIGFGCWLGAHVVITAGVTLGKSNIVGANAVVTHDTPDGVRVFGVPAKIVPTAS